MCCSARIRAKETKGREFDHVCSTIVAALRGLVLTILLFFFSLPPPLLYLSSSTIQETCFIRNISGFLGQGLKFRVVASVRYVRVITLSPHADPLSRHRAGGSWSLIGQNGKFYIHGTRCRFYGNGESRATRATDDVL